MAQICISDAHTDEPRLQPLAHALAHQGWSGFWGRPMGPTYRGIQKVKAYTLAFLIALFTASTISAATAQTIVSQPVVATVGATLVHPGGARLTIAPGGLPGDARVSIRDMGPVPIGRDPVLLSLSHQFVVSVEGVDSCTGVSLAIDVPQRDPRGDDVPRDGVLWVAVDADGQSKIYGAESVAPAARADTLTAAIDLCRAGTRSGDDKTVFFAAQVAFVPHLDYTAAPRILQVPYYWQDSLPWCVPTSLAMTMNQFEDLEGLVANYDLAGADGQASDEGNSYVGILGSLGVHPSVYSYVKWDADLIPSAGFNNYIKILLSGAYPHLTRGLAMSSTTTSHAFVGVGANNQYIWVHDPSGAFAGAANIAVRLTWGEFKAIAMDESSSTELRTLFINKPLRPAHERTGSLVLEEGTNGSFTYQNEMGQTLSRWRWDGSYSDYGYIWDNPTGGLPPDGIFGTRFPRATASGILPGSFAYKTRVANVTRSSRTYEVWIFLGTPLNPAIESTVVNITLPPYSWQNNVVSGVLDTFTIKSDGEYALTFELWEGGTLQDIKRVSFYVGVGSLAMP